MIAGTAISAVGAISSGRANADAARYNAQIAQQNAGIALQQGEADVIQQGKLNYRRLSGIKAAVGASGLTMEGSPLDVLESSAAEAELDTQNIRYNASLKALGFNTSAGMDRSRAANAEREGLYRAAATSILGGAQAYGRRGTGTPLRLNPDLGPVGSNLDFG